MMESVRAKLVALVVACTAPAVAGAALRAREAESTLLDQATRRVDRVNASFAAEMDDYKGNAKLALALVDHAAKFRQALAARDAAGAERLVATLAEVYKYRIVLAADADGNLAAVGNAERAPKSLRVEASPALAELRADAPASRSPE
jgi:hypothetical protein